MVANRSFFLKELERLGPDRPVAAYSIEESHRYCRQLSQTHYENFRVVSWFLPKRLHQDFATLYSFCRWSDDLADEIGNSRKSLLLLDWWRQQLDLCYSSGPTHPVMISLQQTIFRHNVPIQPFEQLLSAFGQDQVKIRYATRHEILDYCSRSANPVGRLVLRLSEADCPENIALSDAICTGLQLANFCQDMARDAANDRIYAPADLQTHFGVGESMILARQSTPELRAMLKQWTVEARSFFLDGSRLIERVPDWLRVDIDLFVRGGLASLTAIERQDFDVWRQRPTVSKSCQAKLLLQAALSKLAGELTGKLSSSFLGKLAGNFFRRRTRHES